MSLQQRHTFAKSAWEAVGTIEKGSVEISIGRPVCSQYSPKCEEKGELVETNFSVLHTVYLSREKRKESCTSNNNHSRVVYTRVYIQHYHCDHSRD